MGRGWRKQVRSSRASEIGDGAVPPRDKCDELFEVEKENESDGGLCFVVVERGFDRKRRARLLRIRSARLPLELVISPSSSSDDSEYPDAEGEGLRS